MTHSSHNNYEETLTKSHSIVGAEKFSSKPGCRHLSKGLSLTKTVTKKNCQGSGTILKQVIKLGQRQAMWLLIHPLETGNSYVL